MMRNQQQRQNQKEAIRIQQVTQAEKNYREAERLKHEAEQHRQMINLQRDNETLKNQNMKNMIRANKEEALEQRMVQKE